MAESWLKKATRKASRMGTRSRQAQKCSEVTCCEEAARISFALASNSAEEDSGRIKRSTFRPAARSPLRPISQRGLSGKPKHMSVYAIEGKAATPSIHRQALSPMGASSAFDKKATQSSTVERSTHCDSVHTGAQTPKRLYLLFGPRNHYGVESKKKTGQSRSN